MKNKLAKRVMVLALAASMFASLTACGGNKRSEERRVGKECL